HIQWRYHYIHDDIVASGKATVYLWMHPCHALIPTADMFTDIFTKALPREKHWKFLDAMGLQQCSSGSVRK
ncbi:hypothetical protein K439DRAFT_1339314, partial [Ramaria rubella]